MNFKTLAKKRFSARGFTDQQIATEQINYILECARLAPSAVNKQPWHFYVVKSTEAKTSLHECYKREWFYTAPLYIVCCICHDEAWTRPIDHKEHGDIDIAIATEHICLAATELGLGSCWVCNFDPDLCKQALQIPDNIEPAVIVPIGQIAPGITPKPKQRKELADIITIK